MIDSPVNPTTRLLVRPFGFLGLPAAFSPVHTKPFLINSAYFRAIGEFGELGLFADLLMVDAPVLQQKVLQPFPEPDYAVC